MSNWIRPHRFGKLSCFLSQSDSCLASVPAGLVLVVWAGALRNCIMFPIPWTAEPLNPTLGEQLDCAVRNHSGDSHLFWKFLAVGKEVCNKKHHPWLWLAVVSVWLITSLPSCEHRAALPWFNQSLCCLPGNGWAGIPAAAIIRS